MTRGEVIGAGLVVFIAAFFAVSELIEWDIARRVRPYLEGTTSARAAGEWIAQDASLLDEIAGLQDPSDGLELVRGRLAAWPRDEARPPLALDGVRRVEDGLEVLVHTPGGDASFATGDDIRLAVLLVKGDGWYCVGVDRLRTALPDKP